MDIRKYFDSIVTVRRFINNQLSGTELLNLKLTSAMEHAKLEHLKSTSITLTGPVNMLLLMRKISNMVSITRDSANDLNRWLQMSRRIKSGSVYEHNINNFSVDVKIMCNNKDNTLPYEYHIGQIINKHVLKLIPHFVVTLGYFKCNRNIKGDNLSCCTTSPVNGTTVRNCDNLILENLQDGSDLGTYVEKTKDPLDVMDLVLCNVLIQVLCSLYVANKEVGFSHNNLHKKNVMIQILPKICEFRYVLDNTHTYSSIINIKTTIIDYGSSYLNSTTLQRFQPIRKTLKYAQTSGLHDICFFLSRLGLLLRESGKKLPKITTIYQQITTLYPTLLHIGDSTNLPTTSLGHNIHFTILDIICNILNNSINYTYPIYLCGYTSKLGKLDSLYGLLYQMKSLSNQLIISNIRDMKTRRRIKIRDQPQKVRDIYFQ
jgi:hypothetical protein